MPHSPLARLGVTVVIAGSVFALTYAAGNWLIYGTTNPQTPQPKVVIALPAAPEATAPTPVAEASAPASGTIVAMVSGTQTPVAEAISATTAPAAPAVAAAAAAAAAPAFDAATYTPDVGRGEKLAAKCKACHTFEKGAPNRVGPNQWGVAGGALAHAEGFAYSPALLEKKATTPVWSDEALDAFLTNPKAYIPGTKMVFAGLKDPAERADLIAWLKTLK